MKIKIIFSIVIMTVVAVTVFYQGIDRKTVNRVSAQGGGGCASFSSINDYCFGDECGSGLYTITAEQRRRVVRQCHATTAIG